MKTHFATAVTPPKPANDTAQETLQQFSFGAAVKKDSHNTPDPAQPVPTKKPDSAPKP